MGDLSILNYLFIHSVSHLFISVCTYEYLLVWVITQYQFAYFLTHIVPVVAPSSDLLL
jgi:hypothetical protein